MKTRKILAIAIITVMFVALLTSAVKAAAVLYQKIVITTETLTVGQTTFEIPTSKSVEKGKTLQLKAYFDDETHTTPTEGTGEETVTHRIAQEATNVTWTSSATSVATISSTGLVTAVKAGTTTISATSPDLAQPGSASITITVTEAPAEFTDISNMTFKVDDITRFNSVNITFKNFTPLDGHDYSVFVTQDASYTFDETMTVPNDSRTMRYDEEKKVHFINCSDVTSKMISEETKDVYLVIIDRITNKNASKMILKPTKIEKPKIKANLGGGYIESWHYDKANSSFSNRLWMSTDRKVTYKLGQVTDNSILSSISKEEAGSFSKLLAYAKADSNSLASGSFNFEENKYEYSTSNIAVGTGKVSGEKYYYVYAVADTVNGKYVPVEDVVVFNGMTDGTLTHFAFAGSQETEPYTPSGNTTTPTNTSGDISIATKRIPQTGATPVFVIVLGSVVLVAGVLVIANKKYKNIK